MDKRVKDFLSGKADVVPLRDYRDYACGAGLQTSQALQPGDSWDARIAKEINRQADEMHMLACGFKNPECPCPKEAVAPDV